MRLLIGVSFVLLTACGAVFAADAPSAPAAAPAAAAPSEEGFVPLFNGKDLTGWDGNPKFWSAKVAAATAARPPRRTPRRATRSASGGAGWWATSNCACRIA